MATVGRWTGHEAKLLRTALRLSLEAFAAHLGVSPGTISKWERRGSDITPLPETQSILDIALERATPQEQARFRTAYAAGRPPSEAFVSSIQSHSPESSSGAVADEVEALDLARRVAASDVGDDTLPTLEATADSLACDYPRSSPVDLLVRSRHYLTYVARLMDARMTLSERRRLMVVGGWISLLAATCEIDLGRRNVASLRLRAAAHLASETDHPEILGWVLETRAWQHLTEGNYHEAVRLAQSSQSVAPRNSSAFIQAIAQEGRAWSRLGDAVETRRALARVERLVEPLPAPERPEHHFRYDPAKSDAYLATTLSWMGDPAAEPYARGVLERIEGLARGNARPRRAASARLDLALALLAANQPEEAVHRALEAVTSGRLVPSSYWRAAEIVAAVEQLRIAETDALRDAYLELTR